MFYATLPEYHDHKSYLEPLKVIWVKYDVIKDFGSFIATVIITVHRQSMENKPYRLQYTIL